MNADPPVPAAAPLLTARGLVMDFPGVRALDGVDFSVRAGEVHGLMGENGAGKSTLIKIINGLHRAGAGTMTLAGRPCRPRSVREAERAGISTVHQEVDLIPTMTIADNIGLGRASRFGFISRRAVRRRAEAALARLGLRLDVTRTLGEHPIARQQMVAIARALDTDARVLILDEPTSSLDADEAAGLFRVLRRLRTEGMGIVFVTHFLEQVYAIADRITVLRNGVRVGEWPVAELSRAALVEAMTGRRMDELPRIERRTDSPAGPEALTFRGLARSRAIAPTSGTARAGEAIGFAGLLGSGRTELARLIFGADVPDAGEVRVKGERIRRGSVRDAIAHGVAFTPEDRKADGLILDLTVRENIALALQARRGPLKPVRRAEQDRLADHYIRALRITTPGPETPVANLSGGNQQKVLLARWLAMQPRILILDEPTRGIDVGSRAEIESLIAGLREQGLAIVLISGELEELARVCDRVLVLRDRAPAGELERGAVSERAILERIAAGGAE